MCGLLEFFGLQNAVPLLLLIWLLQFVGTQFATTGDSSAAPRLWARGFAAAAFLAYACLAIAEWDPVAPLDFLAVGLQALLAMGTAHGLALVIASVVQFVRRQLWTKPAERKRQAIAREAQAQFEREMAERSRAEQERKAAEERRQQEAIANRPPPPTREQRMAAAKQRYESVLQMLASAHLDPAELQAARDRAKQQYLRELDEVMK